MTDDVDAGPVFSTLPMLTSSGDGQAWPMPVLIKVKNSATRLGNPVGGLI